ncbi:histone-lysine N-methyltransferase ATX2-like [Heracleum sosnowskyi]|uniref:Histone-lysine N-methyltransferase ATX2-like n=1 Tax=Heracleum sosnowskyi TaxID=360622 RepID=A0AAD8JDD7_9APIA|nr:histone-lysine N-methyltransferase ATX2-like [Heracleum sosnowskyi]
MNAEDVEEIAGAPLKYVPLREVYDATAPPPKHHTIRKCFHSDPADNRSSELRRKSKRKRVRSAKLIQLDNQNGNEHENKHEHENNSAVVVGLASPTHRNKMMRSSPDVECKQWTRLKIDADYKKFIGLKCKVHWPLDDDWYYGRIVGYDPVTERHHIKYKDGDEEHLILSNERISFYVSPQEMMQLQLSYGGPCPDSNNSDIDEIIDLAATLDDCCDLDPSPGDIIWAKVTGHSTWPAVVLDESASSNLEGLNKISGEKSFLVQFFCTHDFARLSKKQVIPFLTGLLSDFDLKCKKSDFVLSLVEAKMYLSSHKLPNRMLSLRKSNTTNYESASGEDEGINHLGDKGSREDEIHKDLEDLRSCPFEIGSLKVISLGKIVKDSDCFYDCKYICPEGYTAVRKFPSISDLNKCVSYKMEVLRDGIAVNKPLFRVTSEEGEQFEGPTSSSCWDKIYSKVRKMHFCSDALKVYGEHKKIDKPGPDMFGFSDPKILKLILLSSTSKLPSDSLKSTRCQDLPVGYRPIQITWKDLDKCNVCHMDEEYENNPFLQCDSCRMMVHTRCYGEREPVDGILWYCNLCRVGAPEFPPPCCLCPLTGGAMKQTTDGRWAHLACAIWIPETCLVDTKKMEPIDGLNRINKDRWNLLCSICGVSHGACIQCSNNSCYVAYHPLCARAAGFCLELEDEDRLHLIPGEDDEESQCVCLLSYCKRHRPSSNQRPVANDRISQNACQQSDFIPTPNPSGSARTEPYNYLGRRGRKEPQACGTVSLKRLYVENRPYLVRGFSQHESLTKVVSSQCNTSRSIFSMAEKYSYMKKTFRKRLAFGKSGIHGYGIFAKQQHIAGDMVIEYTGELVRAPIADRREHLIYNSFVGAGTYMFRIDDDRVIDATKAGSIAHLINHSCEPNCYSRVITVNGDEHIIIFSKRDIRQWEELTYDYRFLSIDEQLACYCGFPRCRGVVNDVDAEERVAKLCVPRSDLTAESGINDSPL